MSQEYVEMLEGIALDVREEVASDLKRIDETQNTCEAALYLFLGECGYAAWKVICRLKGEMDNSKIKIYSFGIGAHYVVGIGDNFENSWRIDPVLRSYTGELIDKLVTSPHEEYTPATIRSIQPNTISLEKFEYFVKKFNESYERINANLRKKDNLKNSYIE